MEGHLVFCSNLEFFMHLSYELRAEPLAIVGSRALTSANPLRLHAGGCLAESNSPSKLQKNTGRASETRPATRFNEGALGSGSDRVPHIGVAALEPVDEDWNVKDVCRTGCQAHWAPTTTVSLSMATPPGDAYSWNDSNPKRPVILSERSESKNLPRFGAKLRRVRPC